MIGRQALVRTGGPRLPFSLDNSTVMDTAASSAIGAGVALVAARRVWSETTAVDLIGTGVPAGDSSTVDSHRASPPATRPTAPAASPSTFHCLMAFPVPDHIPRRDIHYVGRLVACHLEPGSQAGRQVGVERQLQAGRTGGTSRSSTTAAAYSRAARCLRAQDMGSRRAPGRRCDPQPVDLAPWPP